MNCWGKLAPQIHEAFILCFFLLLFYGAKFCIHCNNKKKLSLDVSFIVRTNKIPKFKTTKHSLRNQENFVQEYTYCIYTVFISISLHLNQKLCEHFGLFSRPSGTQACNSETTNICIAEAIHFFFLTETINICMAKATNISEAEATKIHPPLTRLG